MYLSCLIFLSCTTIKKVHQQNEVLKEKFVYLKLNCPNNFDRTLIDSNIFRAVQYYNNASRAVKYIYTNDTLNYSNIITLKVTKQKFASNGSIITGYIGSAIGLIGIPVYYSITEGGFIGAAAVLAFDKILVTLYYSNWNLNNRVIAKKIRTKLNALFREREKRKQKLADEFCKDILSFLIKTGNAVNNLYYLDK